jgi:ABC-type transport system involved in multi-copper enzyme maturation permease subunit
MYKFITLLKTEYTKRKSSYWTPVWIILGITAVSLLAALIAAIGNWADINIGMMDMSYDFDDMQSGMRLGAYGSMMFVIIVFLVFLIINTSNSLSKEKQLGCDLFYRCQPVSIWSITAAKYVMHVFASTLWLIGVGLIYILIITIVSSATIGGFYLGSTFVGLLMGVILYLKICLVFGSLFFLFSAIFKNNSLIKGAAILGIVEFLFFAIEELLRNTIKLPSVYGSLASLLGNLNFEEGPSMASMILDYRVLIAILFAGVCYAGATLIYKYKTTEA